MDRPGIRNRARVASFMLFACLVLAPAAALAAPGGLGNGNGNGNGNGQGTADAPPSSGDPVGTSTGPADDSAGGAKGKSDEAHGNDKKDDPAPESSSSDSSSAPSGATQGDSGVKGKSDGAHGNDQKDAPGPDGQKGGGNGPSTAGSKHGYDPDPPAQLTPPAAKRSTQCPDYSQESGGPYDHDNCDGSQGLHGNGGNGKCAGCTGKADDKSPGGQYPGDHNNGYECDHNKGVGKGNPAHSKCSPTPPCTVNCNPGCQVNCNPDCLDLRSAAECEDDDVLGLVLRRPAFALRGDAVAGAGVAGVAGAALPFTGGEPAGFVLTGLTLIVAGACMTAVMARKRRRNAYLDREGLPSL